MTNRRIAQLAVIVRAKPGMEHQANWTVRRDDRAGVLHELVYMIDPALLKTLRCLRTEETFDRCCQVERVAVGGPGHGGEVVRSPAAARIAPITMAICSPSTLASIGGMLLAEGGRHRTGDVAAAES